METTFFAGAGVEETELSTGARIGLPVRYYEWSALMAHFPAPSAALRGMLPSGRLRPAELIPGTGVVSLAAMEYRRIADVQPYNEFGIMIPVLYGPSRNVPALPLLAPQRFKGFGLYVHHLPVTTEEARVFGIEIWGYPKFLAEIDFEETGQVRRCRLRADGKDILTLEVAKTATRAQPLEMYSYTVKDGQLLRTRVQAEGQMGVTRLRGGACCDLGDHPIAEELRALRMSRTAVERLYAPQVQSMLHAAAERLPL